MEATRRQEQGCTYKEGLRVGLKGGRAHRRSQGWRETEARLEGKRSP